MTGSRRMPAAFIGHGSPMNTLDWLTRIRIKDPARGETDALVHLNAPYDYGGYRFFQILE